jgi:hypothetical protein
MNQIPLFGTQPLLSGVIATGIGNRPGTSGTYNLLFSSATNNYRVERISVLPNGPITASFTGYAIRLYVSNNSGTTLLLIREGLVDGSTINTQTPVNQYQFYFPGGLNISSGTSLWVSQSAFSTASTVSNWIVEGTLFSGGQPIYPLTNRFENYLITSASTRNNTNTLFKIFTAGVNGSRVEQIFIRPNVNALSTSQNKLVWLFIKTSTGNIIQYKESVLRQITPNTSTIFGNETYFNFVSGGLLLEPNQELYGGISTWSSSSDDTIFNIEAKDF